MNPHKSAVAIELLFNKRLLTGVIIPPDDFYWSCVNIFECDGTELTYDDVQHASLNDIPQNTFLHFPCSVSNYKYCDSISVGLSNNELHFRFSISYHLSTWDENLNFRGFFELMHSDIQQSSKLKVSDCYHDEHDYILEVEFTGDTTISLGEQVQWVLLEVRQFHNFNIRNVL